MTYSPTVRTQEERTESAKRKIRAAALELFALQGYESTTLADISLRAGYSRALAQYHYGDKASLALELLEDRLRRDMNAELLACDATTTSTQAWAMLQGHLTSTSEHFRRLHGKGRQSLLVRGEMVLHHAANMSMDPEVKARLNAHTGALLAAVAHILDLCRSDGFIRSDVDPQAVSVFYVHAIWGLASALFANPNGEAPIAKALVFLGQTLETLRASRP